MRRPSVPQPKGLLLCALVAFSLQSRCNGQGAGSTSAVTLSNSLFQPQPIILAPNSLAASLHFEETYSLSQPDSKSLLDGTSANFTIAANSTFVISEFSWTSCVVMQLSAPDSAVYGFVTNADYVQYTGSDGRQVVALIQGTSAHANTYAASALTSNGTLSRLLAVGPNATSVTGPVPTNTDLGDSLTLVLVNPTSTSVSVTLEVGLSPLGPCNTCSTQRDSDGLLGNCGTYLRNATVLDGRKVVPATNAKPFLQPTRRVLRDVDQGSSSVFAAFTNAACMLYTVNLVSVPTDLSLNKAQLYAWVATSAEQEEIVSSGNVTLAQRLTLGCSYPATTNPNRPCFNFSNSLDPNETYYVWVQNANGGTAVYQGNITVQFELMVLRDTADCSQARLFNLSASGQYLNNATSTPLNFSPADTVELSPYDPGVNPFAFKPVLTNTAFNFPVVGVGSDGSLSQVGFWNITQTTASAVGVAQVTDSNASTLVISPLQSRSPGFPFSNAACFYENLNASQPVTSYLLPRSAAIANYNYSATAKYTGLSSDAFNSRVANSGQVDVLNVNAVTTGLSPTETYSFFIQRASSNNTNVMTRTVAYPTGSPYCHTAVAPASAAAQSPSYASFGGVRGINDDTIPNVGSDGGANNFAAITGAACIAFAISARGLRGNNTAPPLNSQYYNISSPGNSTATNMSASAVLLQGSALNQQFVLNGFVDPTSPQQSRTSIPILAGCLVNYTSPGPCVAYADNLNSSELYYLWGVSGGTSPAFLWVLASYEARPSGSCKDAYALPKATPPVPAPAPAPVPAPAAAPASPASISVNMTGPASKKVSIGVIVGPAVGGAAVIAAVVLLVVWLLKSRRPKPLPYPARSNVFIDSKVVETDNYAYYKDAMGQNDVESAEIGMGGESLPSPFEVDSVGSESGSVDAATGLLSGSTADSSPGPADVVADVAVPADSRLQTGTGPRTPELALHGAAESPTLIIEHVDQGDFELSELKLKIVDGKPVKLGEGGFGSVYLGFLGVREVAVKIANGTSAAQKESFLHEILVLKGCRDPNVVLFLGASVGEQIVLLMEFMAGGDLYKAIRTDATGRFRWWRRGANLALDIVEGLYHLHSRGIVHMDLKSPNILLTEDQRQAKISDVGLAKFITENGTSLGEGLSGAWASPEQILSGKSSAASDMFSFGVILWEICSGESPTRLRHYRPIRAPEECPQVVADLIAQCLLPDPPQRLTAEEAHKVLCKCVKSNLREMTTEKVSL